MAYFYLRSKAIEWPPNVAPPPLLWGTLNTGVLLASCVPNHLTKTAAEDENLRGVQVWLLVSIAFGLVFSAVRGFEFAAINVQWDTNAYGSILWALLALHTMHIGTDLADTMVLTALMFTRHARGRRFVDVCENSFYWYFVVLTWLPIYAVIYLVPRVM